MKPGIKCGKQELSPIFLVWISPPLRIRRGGEFVSDFGIRISNFPFEDLFEQGLVTYFSQFPDKQ